MGLSLGLERGQVNPDDLAKARAMLPRALEQYVIGKKPTNTYHVKLSYQVDTVESEIKWGSK